VYIAATAAGSFLFAASCQALRSLPIASRASSLFAVELAADMESVPVPARALSYAGASLFEQAAKANTRGMMWVGRI